MTVRERCRQPLVQLGLFMHQGKAGGLLPVLRLAASSHRPPACVALLTPSLPSLTGPPMGAGWACRLLRRAPGSDGGVCSEATQMVRGAATVLQAWRVARVVG